MVEKTKVHFAWNEVKTSILESILESNGPISEPSIRNQLHGTYGAADQGLINRQLHSLESAGCVEKVTPSKKSRSNYWDIKKIKTFKNILAEFPDMKLHKHKKFIYTVLKEFYGEVGSMLWKRSYVQLYLSPSFSIKCLDTDLKTLCNRVSKLNMLSEYSNGKRYIESLTHGVYTTCMKRISKIPDFSNIKISEEKFKKMLSEIKFSWDDQDYDSHEQRFVKELSKNISKEVVKETPASALDQIETKIFEALIEEFQTDLPNKIRKIVYSQYVNSEQCLNMLFEHFYSRDVVDGTAGEEEVDFVSEVKNASSEKIVEKANRVNGLTNLDQIYNKWYEKIKKKEKVSI